KPDKVETELGIERFDEEGRCLKLTFKDFILFNFYIPNGARDKRDIPYKIEVYKELFKIFKDIKNKNIILCGDFNIAHSELDVFNSKQNENNTMFTPIERTQIDELINLGFTDTFRYKYPEREEYTWWPYMGDLRERNVGWRIDYIFVSDFLKENITEAFSEIETTGSDHGPYNTVFDFDLDIKELPKYKKSQGSLF
ncbi:MAG: exodeoxyribonuclease III, partial [Candidatus Pacebacteria bacterium]|nr:exodeoxyribonuclease III [Candidatus Paceibacterota bacterium]